jgi:hypothetical protein
VLLSRDSVPARCEFPVGRSVGRRPYLALAQGRRKLWMLLRNADITAPICTTIRLYHTGCVRAEPIVWRTSWTALTLWKLANGRPLRHGELSCPWRRSCRRFPSSLRRRAVAGPPTVRFSTTGANMVCRTKERALDPLLVPALLALATPSIC